MTIWECFAQHSFGHELKAISQRLDRHPRIFHWAAADLIDPAAKNTGRKGLSVDSIIRAAIIKQSMDLSYDRLAFQIEDSLSIQAFTRINRAPSAATLQAAISRIKAATWEKINRALLQSAHLDCLEKGRVTRTDSTVMEANIHQPSDSTLLEDAQRTMARYLTQAQQRVGLSLTWVDHRRVCKKLARQIQYSRKKRFLGKAYKRLIDYVKATCAWLSGAKLLVATHPAAKAWHEDVEALLPLVARIVSQAEKRVLLGEKVPANEKIVSLFEPHTDILVKGNRLVQYGHKLNLTTGASGLVIDLVVQEGNPADSKAVISTIERQIEIYGRAPKQVSFDGGYASKENLKEAKRLGVKDVAFHKKKGLKVEAMVKSQWVYRKLIAFRAGVEGNISTLKRRYGWTRCTWKGWHGFQAYAWASVVAYNLITMAKLSIRP